jgi:hypothetical protein
MIPSLFLFQFKLRWYKLLAAILMSLILGALAAWMYTPDRLAELLLIRQELPEVFTFLGMEGSPSLGIHLMGTVYGFLLPLLVILHSVSSGYDLIAKPLFDGRMAMLLASKHRRGAILGTLCLIRLVEFLLLIFCCLLGQVILSLTLIKGANLVEPVRLALGFMLVSLPYPACAAIFACIAKTPQGMRRASLFLLLLTLLMAMLSRLQGALQSLRFLTPLSFFRGAGLAAGNGGWVPALYALPVAMVLYILAFMSFSKREL